ncbi:hypothetical protein PsorP6_009371 [Peronosclerospora sorghi]|uniref:Uncharacterized protein n=1 Tax=Peronosclerospora sorghi TaxID=230839 RepID=A0ACC0VXA3_9STRA|nr:hypothetical protein PsorP6_009371 [Peronosclerospora sorghi]
MTSSLIAFDAQLATYLNQLHELLDKNQRHHVFQPKFWLTQPDFDVAREVFVASAAAIGHTVTKFALVYSKTPSQEEGASICEALAQPCAQLLAGTNVALFCGAGPSLATEILTDAIRLIKSVHDLALSIKRGELKHVPQLTGRVWEHASSFRVSKSNCVASKRSMLQCIAMLNSTIDELNEFVHEEKEGHGQTVALDNVDQHDAFEFDANLTDEEHALFESALQLLSMCAAIMKRGVLTIKKLTIENDQEAFLTWTATLDVSYTLAQDAIVDFGAALYPPIGVDALKEALSELETSATAILTCMKEMPDLAVREETALGVGEAAFAKQLGIVKNQIEAFH